MPEIDEFIEVIKKAVRLRIDEIMDDEVETAMNNVERRVKDLADTIALSVLKSYEIERYGSTINIRVLKEK